jgi:hypothetical protein
VEEILRVLVAGLGEETHEPVIAHHKFLTEVGLEEVAVEERDVRRRAAVQRAEVPDERVPKRALGGAQAAAAVVGGRLLAEFERLRVCAAGGVGGVVIAPVSEDALQRAAGVNVAILANAEKQEAVKNALDGFVQLGAFEEVRAVVVLEEVGGEFAAGFFASQTKRSVGWVRKR